ncbi:unnamed protein product, partial [Effrenium voratum]
REVPCFNTEYFNERLLRECMYADMNYEVRIEHLDQGSTTLIMRGLNRQITNSLMLPLLDELPPRLHQRAYDFVYVPWATNGASNIGLAFVNFETHDYCRAFLQSLRLPVHQKKLVEYGVRSVGQAFVQGRGANLCAILAKRGRAGFADHDAPLVYSGGQEVPLHFVLENEGMHQWQREAEVAQPSAAAKGIPSRAHAAQTYGASCFQGQPQQQAQAQMCQQMCPQMRQGPLPPMRGAPCQAPMMPAVCQAQMQQVQPPQAYSLADANWNMAYPHQAASLPSVAQRTTWHL